MVKIKKLQPCMSQQFPRVYPESHWGQDTETLAPSPRASFQDLHKTRKNIKRLAAELVGSNDCPSPPRKGEEDQIQHFATLEENSSFLLKNKQLKAPCTVVSPATTQVGQIEVFSSIKEQKDSISIQFSGVFCSNAPNNRLAGRSRLAKKLYSAR